MGVGFSLYIYDLFFFKENKVFKSFIFTFSIYFLKRIVGNISFIFVNGDKKSLLYYY